MIAGPEPAAPAAREVPDRSGFFGALPAPAREELVARLGRLDVPAGTTVVREGDEGGCYYLIGAGQAEVWGSKGAAPLAADEAWVPDPHRHVLLARLGPGDGFGEMALLLSGRRRATVRAATDLLLYTLDGPTFTRVVNQHRGLAVALEEEMTLRAVGAFLGRSSPFASLPPEALRWLALRLQPVAFQPGETIVRQGEPGDAFYVVRTGQVEVVAPAPAGDEHRITTLGPGDPFGEQALVTGETRSASVRALEATEVLRLRREDFEAVLRRHRERGSYFLQLTMQRQRPQRIVHWAMERRTGRDDEVVYILKDTQRNRYLKLSEQGAFLWELMDGRHTVRDLTMAYFTRYHLFGLDAVLGAMMQLSAAGFVRIQRVDAQRIGEVADVGRLQRVALVLLPWLVRYFSLPDVDGAVTWLYRHLSRPLYSRLGQALLLLIALAGAGLFLRYFALGGIHPPAGAAGRTLVLASVLGFVLQGLLHETAHAVTTKHFGREVHRAGVGWYLFMPVAFVDTSDMWLAGRWARASVAFAGPYTNFILSAAATLLLLFTADATLRVILFQFALTGYVLGLVNLNPLLEFDGYYVLMDALEVPNLRAKALAYLGALAWRAGRSTRDPRLQRIFTAYGALALLYTLVVAATTMLGYHRYMQGLVTHALPPLLSGLLGWLVAGVMAWLILARAWGDLRKGARQGRSVRARAAAT